MKNLATAILLLVSISILNAQTYEYTDIRMARYSSGQIVQGNEIKGYYTIYPTEKVDKKSMAFEISMLDDNLNQVTKFQIVRPKKYYLLETAFNDEAFLFHFYDLKNKVYEFVSIDRSGKELASIVTDKLSKVELYHVTTNMQSEIKNSDIYALGSNGFMRVGLKDNKKVGYSIQAFNSQLEKQWEYASDPQSKMVEEVEVLSWDSEFVLVQKLKKKNRMTAKFDTHLALLDAKTGEVYYDIQMLGDTDNQLSVLNAFLNDGEAKSYIIGEYYLPGDNVLKDKSLGIYIRGMAKNGDIILTKKFSWNKDVARLKKQELSEEEMENDKSTNQLYFHNVVRAKNGHIFAIAEAFSKEFSAAGAAIGALSALGGSSSDVSAFDLKVTNMVIVEFDENLDLVDYEVVEKKKSRVLLPNGAGYYSPQKLGYYVKMTGDFDYGFTLNDSSKDEYHVLYTDLNRRDDDSDDKADAMIGSISIENGEISTERVPINSDAKRMWIEAAKPGYVLIREYFKKEKKLSYRLEKIKA